MSAEGLSGASEWLKDEDFGSFEDRASRLAWLVDNLPVAEYWTFPGGLLAQSLFEEARYCFVYGQFLSTIFLGLSYIERTLAALFYGAGCNKLERAGLSELLTEALTKGLISGREFDDLERIRKKRNAYMHFRKPLHKDSVEYRSIHENELPYTIIESDATAVIVATLNMVTKNSV